MALDVGRYLADADDLARLTPSPLAAGMKGSDILRIAGEVNALKAEGAPILNLTIGDFNPKIFPIPTVFADRIKAELDAGQTNYPPAVGIPELRSAICGYYERGLGLKYTPDCVQVGSGARPPIFAAFATLVGPGDLVVYPVPTWNVRYYVYLNGADGVAITTKPEDGFMPTAAELMPHISKARLLVLNSPLNPAGTAASEGLLRELCEAIVAENNRRRGVGERPLMVLYDQVYWELCYDGTEHHTPVGLVPEMAPYTVMIDAISKSWAATGMRVGWAVGPPWVIKRMAPLVGHMGAWAARPEQRATAAVLADPHALDDYYAEFKGALRERLAGLRDGLWSMRDAGLPVDALDVQGAIYLTARFDLIGKTVRGREIATADDLRSLLLEEAYLAVVPFSAFGYPGETGWVRMSVGAVTMEDVRAGLDRLRTLLNDA
jgi:aspartate aminotransferase